MAQTREGHGSPPEHPSLGQLPPAPSHPLRVAAPRFAWGASAVPSAAPGPSLPAAAAMTEARGGTGFWGQRSVGFCLLSS